jgi:hypothetical protein
MPANLDLKRKLPYAFAKRQRRSKNRQNDRLTGSKADGHDPPGYIGDRRGCGERTGFFAICQRAVF